MKGKSLLAIVLAFAMVLSGAFVCVQPAEAASWTKSKVNSEIKKTKKDITKYTKLYNEDKKRVKKANKGKFALPGGSPNAVINDGEIAVYDKSKDIYYYIVGGESYLNISDHQDGTGYVTGYVMNVGSKYVNALGKWTQKVKGVKYASNKYESKLKKLKKKKNALEASLTFSYTTKKTPAFVTGTEYDLSKYLKNDDEYNSPSWVKVSSDVANVSSSGKLVFKSPGKASVSVKASVSGKTTKMTVTCVDRLDASIESIEGTTTLSSEGGKYRAVSELGAKFKIVCSSDYDGKFSFKSSNPSMFSVDSDGVVMILGADFGYKETLGVEYSDDYYITASIEDSTILVYLSVPKSGFTIDAQYIPATSQNDFSIQKIYDDNTYTCGKLYSGDKVQLVMNPAPGGNIKYEFSVLRDSFNEVSIDANGLITMGNRAVYEHSQITVIVKLGSIEKKVYLEFYGDPSKK